MIRKTPLLDHGYLKYVEHYGSDERIVEAARMSTGKGFLGWGPKCKHCGADKRSMGSAPCSAAANHEPAEGDEKLLAYLWRNKHTTPFEVPGLTVEVGCPVVVVWQWVRHRTMTYNILSGRYAEMPEDDYLPTLERCLADGGGNKQAGAAKGSASLTARAAEEWLTLLGQTYQAVQSCYLAGLAAGIPKELARLPLGFGRYTRMRVTANLWNWLRFLTLRLDSHAQSEILQYANTVGEIIAELFPRTWALFVEGKS